MNAVQKVFVEDRRLAVLRFLAEDKAYQLNTAMLQEALRAIGHTVSRDEVETQVAWLDEQGLVTVETVGPITVAKLTERGLDCATGACNVPGVKRPGPR